MSLAIADIGLTQEELQDRVIDTMATKLLKTLSCDEDGDEVYASSVLEKKLKEIVEKRIQDAIERTAAVHVLPRVDDIIETFTIQETNTWGEKVPGKTPLTFTEFLVKKAEEYMQEQVDWNGKPKSQSDYNWRASQSRLTHVIHKHMHDHIEKAMKQVIGDGTTQIAKALHETCRVKINEIASKLQVNVSTGN
jgi:hypothetical protein